MGDAVQQMAVHQKWNFNSKMGNTSHKTLRHFTIKIFLFLPIFSSLICTHTEDVTKQYKTGRRQGDRGQSWFKSLRNLQHFCCTSSQTPFSPSFSTQLPSWYPALTLTTADQDTYRFVIRGYLVILTNTSKYSKNMFTLF